MFPPALESSSILASAVSVKINHQPLWVPFLRWHSGLKFYRKDHILSPTTNLIAVKKYFWTCGNDQGSLGSVSLFCVIQGVRSHHDNNYNLRLKVRQNVQQKKKFQTFVIFFCCLRASDGVISTCLMWEFCSDLESWWEIFSDLFFTWKLKNQLK